MAMNKDMTLKQKIEYIKDYYKWHIIIALLLVAVLIFTIVHFATKEEYDIRLFYVGETYFGDEYQVSMNSITDFCTDVTGDNEVNLLFDQFCYGGLNDPQYLTTMTATLEKMIAKEENVCLILADKRRAEMIISMAENYILPAENWAKGKEDYFLRISDFSGAVWLKDSAYIKGKGFDSENLYLIFLKEEGRDKGIYINAENVANKLIVMEERDVVSEAIIARNENSYLKGECVAEGHVILTDKEVGGKRVVSLLASYGEYGFENGNFVKVSGSGAIPARITFDEDGKVTEYLEAEDGAGYIESIKKMYDEEAYALYEKYDKEDAYSLCIKQEYRYAKKYLEKIGREAEIGEYKDFPHNSLTDMGVSVEVSNMMLSRKDEYANYYPYFVGNAEHIIDGVRYIFVVAYDEEAQEILYNQYEYGKGGLVRGMIYSSVTGELLRVM